MYNCSAEDQVAERSVVYFLAFCSVLGQDTAPQVLSSNIDRKEMCFEELYEWLNVMLVKGIEGSIRLELCHINTVHLKLKYKGWSVVTNCWCKLHSVNKLIVDIKPNDVYFTVG